MTDISLKMNQNGYKHNVCKYPNPNPNPGRIKKLNRPSTHPVLMGPHVPPPGPQGGPYLGGLLGQLKRNPLADLRRQLVQHVGLEAADHHLAEAAMQLVQVGGTTAVPLPPPTKVPAKKKWDKSGGVGDWGLRGGFMGASFTYRGAPWRNNLFHEQCFIFEQSNSSAGLGQLLQERLFLFNDQQQQV